ncbi:c-type cytochrome [Planktotalea sp.]|uniref:c-type cytochrome n=1 Tax=Planktotalea sp. TaxID=2029877 RepID=UPI0025D73BD0|nr:c-type cytochrome [Planktotalea sp.]
MSKFLKILTPSLAGTGLILSMAYVFADQFVVNIPSVAPLMVSAANADEAAVERVAAKPVVVAAAVGSFRLGRAALPEEIAAWNHDVSPDGTGLPAGSGSAYDGEEIFAEHCGVCHGDFAEGVDNWPKLAGGMDTLADEDPLKTVGSYWPHLSTAWDYVNRSMPFGNAQSLSNDDVYAIVAYILYSNDLVDDDFVLTNENFLDVEMPNKDGFIQDDRLTSEAHFWKAEPCMSGCKDSVEITMRATVLDVTPDEGEAEEAAAPAEEVKFEVAEAVEEDAVAEDAPAAEAVVIAAAFDADLAKSGEKVFKKCAACHQVGEGAKNKSGPQLNNIMGRALGGVDGFKYSKTMSQMGADGAVWNEATLAEFLAKPKAYVKKTKMSFSGLKKEKDIAAVTEYLKSVSQ